MANQFGLGFDSIKKQEENMPTEPTIKTPAGMGTTTPASTLVFPKQNIIDDALGGAFGLLPTPTRAFLVGVGSNILDSKTPSEKRKPMPTSIWTESDAENFISAIKKAESRLAKDGKVPDNGYVDYDDYGRQKSKGNIFNYDNNLAKVTGGFHFTRLPDGKYRVTDRYNASNARNNINLAKIKKELETNPKAIVLIKQLAKAAAKQGIDIKENPIAYARQIVKDPQAILQPYAQEFLNLFAGDESTGTPIDFIIDPKTLEILDTPVDSVTGNRPKIGTNFKPPEPRTTISPYAMGWMNASLSLDKPEKKNKKRK
jgi:hypothetical protein